MSFAYDKSAVIDIVDSYARPLSPVKKFFNEILPSFPFSM